MRQYFEYRKLAAWVKPLVKSMKRATHAAKQKRYRKRKAHVS